METDTKQTVPLPPQRFCTCGKPMQWKASRAVSFLVTKDEIRQIVATANGDADQIKTGVEQFDQFECYVLSYRCSDGHLSGTRYDWHYTQEDAELAAQLLNEE